MKIVNSDDIFEKLLDKEGLSKKMPESEKEPRDIVRQKQKDLLQKKKQTLLRVDLDLLLMVQEKTTIRLQDKQQS